MRDQIKGCRWVTGNLHRRSRSNSLCPHNHSRNQLVALIWPPQIQFQVTIVFQMQYLAPNP
ncbi:unnamed protein product, partial [Vitis vinifera]